MTAKEARHQIEVANYMKQKAEQLIRDATNGVDMPRPGSFVRDSRTGKIFVVISDGTVDGFDDHGRYEPDDWIWYDVIQDGAPELPGAPPGLT